MSIISLAPREAATFPYKRFQSSPVIVYSIRKLSALKILLGSQYTTYKANSGMTYEIGEQQTFDQLFTYMDQLIEYLAYYKSLPDESTLHSIKTTLEMLENLMKHFEMHSISPLRLLINRLSRIISTYHRSADIVGYLVDISGTYSQQDTDIKEIEILSDKTTALELMDNEAEEYSKMYTVFANIVNKGEAGSRECMPGVWLIKSKDIFYCSQCAF